MPDRNASLAVPPSGGSNSLRAGKREVRLAGAFNVRDLGGLPVGRKQVTKSGLVYRGDSLDVLTEGDEALLFHQLRVGAILDLRTPEEAGGDGLVDARRFPGLRVWSYPVIPDGRIGVEPFPAGDAEAVAKIYLEYVVDRAAIVAGAIGTIADLTGADVPVLFHCAAGRDRTGVVAAVLLALLGVADRDIVRDYADSNRRGVQVSARLTANPLYRGDEVGEADDTKLVDPLAMRRFLELFRSKFASPRAWAIGAGLEPATVDQLVSTLVVDKNRGAERTVARG